jgi:uncharacterized damage-inducible protein DinB
MTNRAEQLAAQFEAGNIEIIDTITECSDEQWRQPAASEDRSIAVVAHHVAVSQLAFAGFVEKLLAGEMDPPTFSIDMVHQSNEQHARDYADVGKTETIDALQAGGRAILQVLHGIEDEQLDRVAGVFGGQEMSMQQATEIIVIGHSAGHLASIRAAIADPVVHRG